MLDKVAYTSLVEKTTYICIEIQDLFGGQKGPAPRWIPRHAWIFNIFGLDV